MIDFHPATDVVNTLPIAYITDVESKENTTVYESNERNHHVYLSESNCVQIQIITASKGTQSQEMFLLHYQGEEITYCLL